IEAAAIDSWAHVTSSFCDRGFACDPNDWIRRLPVLADWAAATGVWSSRTRVGGTIYGAAQHNRRAPRAAKRSSTRTAAHGRDTSGNTPAWASVERCSPAARGLSGTAHRKGRWKTE